MFTIDGFKPDAAARKRLAEKASRELHENPQEIDAHLTSLARWVHSTPHITFPEDKELLLPFLRHAKYVHSQAQARVDNFCTLRSSPKEGVPQWFVHLPLDDPYLDKYLKMGLVLPLGRTSDDVLMLLMRWSVCDPDQMDIDMLRRCNYMDFERILLDPTVQIAGYGLLMDLTGVSTKQLRMATDKHAMKMAVKIFQDGYPLRTKYLIYYNEPTILDALFKIIEIWISEKLRKRTFRVKKDIDKAYKLVPGLRELMPREYGGENLTIPELTEKNENLFRKFYSHPSPWSSIRIDESKRPEWAKTFMRNYHDVDISNVMGSSGTYIKLDPGE